MLAAAQAYLIEHDLHEVDWRLDVVAVELSARGELLRIDLIENAVAG
jgi:Holliday junction resolvase-like predicted endonuclease